MVTLNIFIGLAFTYLTLSILASTFLEFLAGIFSFRGHHHSMALRKMIEGRKKEYEALSFWKKIFYKWESNSRYVKKLEKKGFSEEPSKKSARFYHKFKRHPLYWQHRTGISRRPSYLSADVFYQILTSLIWTNYKEIREKPIPDSKNKLEYTNEKIDTYLNSHAVYTIDTFSIPEVPSREYIGEQIRALPDDMDLKKVLFAIFSESEGNMGLFESKVKLWYDQMMDRVNGWYRRNAQLFLFVAGLFIAISHDYNSFEMYQQMKYQPEKTAMMANIIEQETLKWENVKDIDPKTLQNKLDRLNNLFMSKDGSSTSEKKIKDEEGFICKLLFFLKGYFGYLITALAISLGASFWFDLLKKLVNLRMSGIIPKSRANKQRDNRLVHENSKLHNLNSENPVG